MSTSGFRFSALPKGAAEATGQPTASGEPGGKRRPSGVSAGEVPIALGPVLDHCGDCAFCILDEIDTGSFHGEAALRARYERDLSRSTGIDHQAAPFQGDNCCGEYGGLVSADILREDFGRNMNLLRALADQVLRVAFVFADILDQVLIWDQIELDRKRPRAGVRLE